MKASSMAAVVFIAGMNVQADGVTPAVNHPRVVAAMKRAWEQSFHGSIGAEATFRLDGNPSEYEIVAAPITGEHMKQTVVIIPGKTFAIFHVHPTAAEPAPSHQDRDLADKYKLKILTMHRRGLFEYDPVEKKTFKLRNGLDWITLSKVMQAQSHSLRHSTVQPVSSESVRQTVVNGSPRDY